MTVIRRSTAKNSQIHMECQFNRFSNMINLDRGQQRYCLVEMGFHPSQLISVVKICQQRPTRTLANAVREVHFISDYSIRLSVNVYRRPCVILITPLSVFARRKDKNAIDKWQFIAPGDTTIRSICISNINKCRDTFQIDFADVDTFPFKCILQKKLNPFTNRFEYTDGRSH